MRKHRIVDEFPLSVKRSYQEYLPALRAGKTVQIALGPEESGINVRRSAIACFPRWILPTDSHKLQTTLRGNVLSLRLVRRIPTEQNQC